MPTPLEEYLASLNSGGPEKPKEEGGLWSSFANLYDKYDQDWLPDSFSGKNPDPYGYAKSIEDNWGPVGKGIGSLYRGLNSVTGGVANALVGSPVRALGTATTVATGPVGIASKLGSALRPVGYLSRGMDAINTLRTGGEAVEQFQQGNYRQAAGQAIGSGLSATGAITPIGTRPPRIKQELPTVKPPVTEINHGLPTSSTNVDRLAMELRGTNQAAVTPPRVNPPEPIQQNLKLRKDYTEEAVQNLEALDLPVNDKTIARYNNSGSFRAKIKEQLGPEKPKPVNVEDIKNELFKRGVSQPSQELVERIRANPKLIDKFGVQQPSTTQVVTPGSKVEGPKQTSLFDADELPEAKLAMLESNSTVPEEVRIAAGQARKKYNESGWWDRFKQDMFTSVETNLERINPELARMEKIRSTDTPILYNQYASRVQSALEGFDPAQDAKLVDYIEGRLANPDEAVKKAGDQIKAVLRDTGQELEGVDLLKKGARGDTYFPHRWEKGFFDDPIALAQRLRANGMGETEVDRVLKYVREQGERKITAQYSRGEFEIPGYRKDRDAIYEHLAELADRVTTAKLYGVKDLDDVKSPLSNVIAQSSDPERARELMKRVLGRDATADGSRGGKEAARVAQNYATASFLSQFAVSNLGGTLPLAMRSSMGEVVNGLKDALKTDLPEMKFMENVNGYQKVMGSIGQAYADNNLITRLFGIEKAQNYMNRVAAGAGRGHALSLFDEIKANPTNQLARKQLEDLTLEGSETLLKQNELTQKQIERSMVRMAEITQGVNEGRKLPHSWNQTGYARIPQIFMRYNYQTTKAIKDALVEDPIKNGAKLIGFGTLLGEFIGNAKEAINTGAEVAANNMFGDGKKELGKEYAENIDLWGTGGKGGRMDFARKELAGIDKLTGMDWANNPATVRAFANLQQAFALGIPFDILSSFTTDQKPNPLDTMVIPSEAVRTIGTAKEAVEKGDLTNVKRELVKRIPFVGRGVAREMPYMNNQGKVKGKQRAQNW